tara:strand:- start:9 stop:998 length:990 start_codon:yes stop_codon:yes gene_type:complete
MPIRSTSKSETYYDFFSASGNEVPFVYPTFNSNGERGIFAGGSPNLSQSLIQYINVASTGNAINFGNLHTNVHMAAGMSNKVRGVFGGGYRHQPSIAAQNYIQYITIASTGNASDFGDLTVGRDRSGSVSNITRGCVCGGSGRNPSAYKEDTIDYVTISSTGNATDFGNLTVARERMMGGSCNGIRGVLWGDTDTSPNDCNVLDYITIDTTGNATDFGDPAMRREAHAASGNLTRGVCGGGYGPSAPNGTNVIEYITIATTGNSQDFGDLTASKQALAALASDTRGVWGGGYSNLNVIEYVTISTTGNGTDFGDLLQINEWGSGTQGDA